MAKQPKVNEADLGARSINSATGGGGTGISQDWFDALDDLVANKIPPLRGAPLESPGPAGSGLPLAGRHNLAGAFVGEKVSNGMPTGERAIQVFVLRKEDDPNRIDPGLNFHGSYSFGGKSYPLDVVELSNIFGGPATDIFSPKYGVELPPEVMCGSCVGNARTGDTGTLGCLVLDEKNNLCILSNAHVLAASGAGQTAEAIGKDKADRIVAPGAATKFPDPVAVGILQRFQKIDFDGGENTVDAALATTAFSAAKPTMHASFKLVPQIQNEPRIGMMVYKQGARTGSTYGQIVGLYASLDLPYRPGGVSRMARFVRQLVIVGIGGPFSLPGDSGSLVLEQATNRPVGLLFSGGTGQDGKDYTFANPIAAVKGQLKIFDFLDKEPGST